MIVIGWLAILTVVSAFQLLMVMFFVRQYLRLAKNSVNANSEEQTNTVIETLPLGTQLNNVSMMSTDLISIDFHDEMAASAAPRVIVFLSDSCDYCVSTLSYLSMLPANAQEQIRIVASADAEYLNVLIDEAPGIRAYVLSSGDLKSEIGVSGVPSAVVVDEKTVVQTELYRGLDGVIDLINSRILRVLPEPHRRNAA